MSMDYEYEEDNLCNGCTHVEDPPECKACSTCIQWVDGYLTAVNYENAYLKERFG